MATEDGRPWPDVAIPSGETLPEALSAPRISQAELAPERDRPVQVIDEVVHGTNEIAPETALQFERVLGVPVHVGVRLETDHRYGRTRLVEEHRLRDEVALARRYPYAAMVKLGWIARARPALDRVTTLLQFFGVSSLKDVALAYEPAHRRAPGRDASQEALAAWLRQGERLGKGGETAPFDASKLKGAIRELRSLTRLRPEESFPLLEARLAECGVARVLVPHLPRMGAHGATRWVSPEKALVQMSLRFRWEDTFWSSLFHELAHVLLHPRRAGIFIEDGGDSTDTREVEANEFAGDVLISRADYAAFVTNENWRTKAAVIAFAKSQYVAPGIVVGRLQHDELLPHTHLNALRRRFVWATTPRPPSEP